MSEYEAPYIPGEIGPLLEMDVLSQDTQETQRDRTKWENIEINGEHFLAQKGRKELITVKGKEVVFNVDTYRHPETGMDIEVYALGMQRPPNQPTIIRADYGCPCMNYPTSFHMFNHDCAQQRELMFNTMNDLGTGVIAIMSEQTAAGNGHGRHVVHNQADMQQKASQIPGQPIPTMEQAYSEMGFYDDIRRHDIVAMVIKETIGDRPALATTANKEKIQHFENAGINLIRDQRVELRTPQSDNRQKYNGRRNYDHMKGQHKPGAYLVNGQNVKLTPKVYNEHFVNPPKTDRIMRIFPRLRRNRVLN